MSGTTNKVFSCDLKLERNVFRPRAASVASVANVASVVSVVSVASEAESLSLGRSLKQ